MARAHARRRLPCRQGQSLCRLHNRHIHRLAPVNNARNVEDVNRSETHDVADTSDDVIDRIENVAVSWQHVGSKRAWYGLHDTLRWVTAAAFESLD